jgi:hypothetical protein
LTISQKSACFYNLGLANRAIGQDKIALRWFHSYMDISSDPSVYIELVHIYSSLKDFKMMANMARSFLADPTGNAEERWQMYQAIVDAYSELNDSSNIIEWQQKCKEEFP